MTGVNFIAARRFTQGQTLRSRIQLYGMGSFFLVLLYNSASGLLLYWTCNNIFAMVRIFLADSIVMKGIGRIPSFSSRALKRIALPRLGMGILVVLSYALVLFFFMTNSFLLDKTALLRTVLKIGFIYMALCATLFFLSRYKNNFAWQCFLLMLIGLWALVGQKLTNPLNNRGFTYYYLTLSVLIASAVLLPFAEWADKQMSKRELFSDEQSQGLMRKTLASFLLLAVGVIPLLLLNNAPGEIVLERPDYINMLIWAVFYLILLPLFFHAALPKVFRRSYVLLLFAALVGAVLNFLVFTGHYGFINDTLQLPKAVFDPKIMQAANLGFLGLAGMVLLALVALRKGFVLKHLSALLLLSLTALTGWSWIQFKTTPLLYSESAEQVMTLEKEIPLSRTEPNTLVLMMDRALGGAVEPALEALPELREGLSGFTWYPNTISYGNCTIVGLPALLGGYDYTPEQMLTRQDMPVIHKVMESWTVLPEIFQGMGNTVYLNDPYDHNLDPDYTGARIDKMDGVTIGNLHGKYTDYWIKENLPWLKDRKQLVQRGKSFFMFSVFRMAPMFIRDKLYDGGMWHSGSTDPEISKKSENWNWLYQLVKPWSVLEYLPEITKFQEKGSFVIFYSMVPHEVFGINGNYEPSAAKIEYPKEDLERYGNLISLAHINTNIAMLKKLTEWFDWMKAEGVYDNTQIVIVADHGRKGVNNPLIPLEDQGKDAIPYNTFHPMLMFKPFGSEGTLEISNEFMTNADTAPLLLEAFGEFKNPRTGNMITSKGKKEGPQLVGPGPHQMYFHQGRTTFMLEQQFTVEGNALDPDCWKRIPESEWIGK